MRKLETGDRRMFRHFQLETFCASPPNPDQPQIHCRLGVAMTLCSTGPIAGEEANEIEIGNFNTL